MFAVSCCILSKFYIKPQRTTTASKIVIVVSYRNSTSNHNFPPDYVTKEELYLIEILHQTTTEKIQKKPQKSCILSKFYIKPQLRSSMPFFKSVVSYRNSTSNHNSTCSIFEAKNVVSYRNSTSNHNQYYPMAVVPSVVSYRNSTSNHNGILHVS